MKFKIGDKVWWHNSMGFIDYIDIGIIISLELDERYGVKWPHSDYDEEEIRIELEEELMLVPEDGNNILKDML